MLDQSEELPTSRDNGNDDDQVGNLDLAEAEASQLNDPYRFEVGSVPFSLSPFPSLYMLLL